MKSYICAGKYDDEIEYYSEGGYGKEYIQLNDNRTVWKLDTVDYDIDTNADIDWDEFYYNLVDEACRQFEEKSGVEVFLLGRSGRHVCVEDTEQNRRRYRSLCNLQVKLENWVISEYNKAVADANNA